MTARIALIEAMAKGMAGGSPHWELWIGYATAALDAQRAALPGLGLQMAPVVATDGMIKAGWVDVVFSNNELLRVHGAKAWPLMLAAAPDVLSVDAVASHG